MGLSFSNFFGCWGRFIISAAAPAIAQDTGWGISQIMLSLTIAQFVYSFVVILIGWLVDTWGGKRVVTTGSICLMFGFASLSLPKELWQLYLAHGVLLAIATSMLRMAVAQPLGRKWFIKRSGLVAAIFFVAYSTSQAILAPVITHSVANIGWRTTCLILTSFGAILLLIARFVIRDTPESMGLHPYGAEERSINASLDTASGAAVPLSQARRTISFWALCLAMGFGNIVMQGFATNVIVWGTKITGDLAKSGSFMTAFSLPAIFAKILWGWLGDRFGKRKMGIFSSVLCIAIMAAAWLWVNDAHSLYAICILYGIVYGGALAVIPPHMGDLFGRVSVGTLIGYLTAINSLIGAVGPVLWSVIFERTGTYNIAALASAFVYLITLICFVLVRPLASNMTGRPKG